MLALTSCKKLVTVDDPINTISAGKMFRNEAQAENALAGVYNSLIHGSSTSQPEVGARNFFAAGLATYAGGLSSGELLIPAANLASNDWELFSSKITHH